MLTIIILDVLLKYLVNIMLIMTCQIG